MAPMTKADPSIWTDALPYFPRHELECRGTGVIQLDARFAAALPALRVEWGRPLTPNSVCRSPQHNASEGGHPRSLHLTDNPAWPTNGTMAADIRWRGWSTDDQLAFARLAWSRGWSVGLHNGFCHVDRRGDLGLPELPQRVFLYGTWGDDFSPGDVKAQP